MEKLSTKTNLYQDAAAARWTPEGIPDRTPRSRHPRRAPAPPAPRKSAATTSVTPSSQMSGRWESFFNKHFEHFSALSSPGSSHRGHRASVSRSHFLRFAVSGISNSLCAREYFLSEKLATGRIRGRRNGDDLETATTSKRRERRCRSASVLHVNLAADRTKNRRTAREIYYLI